MVSLNNHVRYGDRHGVVLELRGDSELSSAVVLWLGEKKDGGGRKTEIAINALEIEEE